MSAQRDVNVAAPLRERTLFAGTLFPSLDWSLIALNSSTTYNIENTKVNIILQL
jgi:hypothetical protein